jgi:hypothetical protein
MMTRFVLLLIALLAAPAWGQRIPVYHNRSTVTNQVVIADAFVNDGYFEVQNLFTSTNSNTFLSVSGVPYDMSGVRRYTNNGTMVGTSIRLDYVDDFGQRGPADSLFNAGGAAIDFPDGLHFGNFIIFEDFIRDVWEFPRSLVHIDAKSIVNQGLIRVGAGGLMRVGYTNDVDGSYNADLVDGTSGLFVVDPVGNARGVPQFTSYANNLILTTVNGQGGTTTYINDLGVSDVAWGMDTFTNMNLRNFVTSFNPTTVNTPNFRLTNNFGVRFLTSFSLDNAQSFGYSFSKTDLTNIIVQAVYIQTGDTNVIPDVRWFPVAYYANDVVSDANNFNTAIIQLSSYTTNALTLQVETNAFYIADQIGPSTNFNIIQNDQFPGYFRPFPFFVTRNQPIEFALGNPTNIAATPNLFFGGFSNVVVTNSYGAYVFDLENLVYSVPPVADASVHDLPGRVEIRGKNVDLTRAGIRGEGLVSIDTDQLVSTTNTVIDSQNLAFNLSYTNAAAPATPLRIENLAKDHVARLQGQVMMWSGVFTNQFGDANSNVFNVLYQVTVVDARGVTSVQEVNVADFRANTASLRLQDNMIVSNRFDVTSSDVTIAGSLDLRNVSFDSASLPNLRNLTIEPTGVLTLVGLGEFGSSTNPLSTFVDQGLINSYSQSIDADTVDISGNMRSGQEVFSFAISPFGTIIFTNVFQTDSGPLYVTANNVGRFTGANLETLGEVTLNGPVFKLDNTHINAGDSVNLNVTSVLTDSGPDAGNVITSANSFSLNNIVTGGSLLGTEIDMTPPPRGAYRFRWGGPGLSDPTLTNIPVGSVSAWVGATNRAYAAFSAGLPIGHLVLQTGTNTAFQFYGDRTGTALFVDLLDIRGTGITNLTSLTNQLRLLADATGSVDIYYANAVATNLQRGVNLGFQSMAEFLNGKQLGNGHLYWVGTFNGPNTSEDVVVNGVSVRMNSALRHSQIIDLDQDGIANGNDDLPLQNGVGALAIKSINISQVDGKPTVNFIAFQGSYQVQYTDSMQNPVWKLAGSFSNPNTTGLNASVTDNSPATGSPRFYRLVYFPAGGGN